MARVLSPLSIDLRSAASGMLSSRSGGPSHSAASSSVANHELDEDLLSLLASDTFSLESHRDRDLLLLSGILQAALPHPTGGPTSASPHWITPAGPTRSSSSSTGAAWNGWRASDTPSAPFNSLNTSSSFHPSSYNNMPPPTPKGTPMTSTVPLPSSFSNSPSSSSTDPWFSGSASSPAGARNSPSHSSRNSTAGLPNYHGGGGYGYRVPAASREREHSQSGQPSLHDSVRAAAAERFFSAQQAQEGKYDGVYYSEDGQEDSKMEED